MTRFCRKAHAQRGWPWWSQAAPQVCGGRGLAGARPRPRVSVFPTRAGGPATSAAAAFHAGRGFTLLEVLLTLLLVSLVLVALAMAVDFQVRVVERSRRNVEEGQLARVLLHRIADDLRGAVLRDPLDMEKLVAEASSAVGSAAGSAEGAAEPEGGEGAAEPPNESAADSKDSEPDSAGMEDVEEIEDMESDETGDTGESVAAQSVPGVYGGADWLQVDVSRLPRLDQFHYLLTSTEGSTTVDRLSDVKTVTYYVIAPEEDATGYAAEGTESGGGLVRRESDRAVSLWASGEGGLEETDSDADPIAPEVASIAFRYWDGSEWVDAWDSSEAGALPAAVEITITLTPIRRQSDWLSSRQPSTSGTTAGEEELLTYSLVVHLQAVQASSGGATEATDEETGESAEMTGSESGETSPADEEPTR